MKSKLKIDLDEYNNPIIELQIIESDDLRDKVAKRFLEKLEGDSIYALIKVEQRPLLFGSFIDGSDTLPQRKVLTISPVTPKEYNMVSSELQSRLKVRELKENNKE